MDTYNHLISSRNKITRREFAALAAIGLSSIILLGSPKKSLAKEFNSNYNIVDDLGRTVSISNNISSIAPKGVPAQTILTTLLPSSITVLVSDISKDRQDYKSAGLSSLLNLHCVNHQLTANAMEELLSNNHVIMPDLIIDAGLQYDGLADELNSLQHATGIQVFFVDISFGNLSKAYETLGRLLNCEYRAKRLSSWITSAHEISFNASKTEKPKVFYAQGGGGFALKSSIDVQLQALEHIGAIPVQAGYDFDKKSISISNLCDTDVDFILFDDTTLLSQLKAEEGELYETWKTVPAISSKRYLVSPALMHSWFGSVVLVQTLGILWLSHTFWFNSCGFNFVDRIISFYSLFYELNLDIADACNLCGICIDGDKQYE